MTFKVGDKVVFDSNLTEDFRGGFPAIKIGRVYRITNEEGDCHPIDVIFENGELASFSEDGINNVFADRKPSLFKYEDYKADKTPEKVKITIPVEVLLSGKTYNGHHQSQLALHGLKDIELINEIAKAFEKHLSDLDGFVWTQVWPDGAWTIYLEANGKQTMLLASNDD